MVILPNMACTGDIDLAREDAIDDRRVLVFVGVSDRGGTCPRLDGGTSPYLDPPTEDPVSLGGGDASGAEGRPTTPGDLSASGRGR